MDAEFMVLICSIPFRVRQRSRVLQAITVARSQNTIDSEEGRDTTRRQLSHLPARSERTASHALLAFVVHWHLLCTKLTIVI